MKENQMYKVLVVDDNDAFRCMIGDVLKTEGYDCTLAPDVKQARSCLERDEFQLILSDFNMPGESGLDLLGYASTSHPNAAMIIMSGCEDPKVQKKALEMGAYAYLAKPFRIRGLLDHVMSALRCRSGRGWVTEDRQGRPRTSFDSLQCAAC
jgi:DNA-binding NtrC family response regulator